MQRGSVTGMMQAATAFMSCLRSLECVVRSAATSKLEVAVRGGHPHEWH